MTEDPEPTPGAATHHEEQNLEALYRDVIFEHYRRPHNKGPVPDAQIVTKGNNPVCGDRVTVYGKIGADGKIEQAGFDGKGCAICIACSSMMTEAVKGKTLEEAEQIAALFKKMMRNEAPFQAFENVPDMEALEGVRKFSVRVKCATLAWTTLRNGILQYEAARKERTAGVPPASGSAGFQPANEGGQDSRAPSIPPTTLTQELCGRETTMNENPPPGQPPAPGSAGFQPANEGGQDARAPSSRPPPGGAQPQPVVPATVDELREALKDVFDPEIPINIVDLGLVYKLAEQDGQVNLEMTLTTPLCPLAGQIKARAAEVLAGVQGVKSVNVNLVFDPPWSKERMTFEGKLQASMLGFM